MRNDLASGQAPDAEMERDIYPYSGSVGGGIVLRMDAARDARIV